MQDTRRGRAAAQGVGPPVQPAIELGLTPRRVAVVLAATAALLVLAGIAGELSRLALDRGRLGGIVPLFNLDAEGNVPAFFSALLLVIAAVGIALIARWRAQNGLRHARQLGVLAAVVLFLGVDEATAIHELFSEPLRDGLGLSGLLYYAWVVAYGVAAAAFFAVFAPLLRYVGRTTRRLLALSALLYVGGALGMELAGSAYTEASDGADDGVYATFTTVEETLEIAAVILLIYTVLRCLERQTGSATVRLLGASDPVQHAPAGPPPA